MAQQLGVAHLGAEFQQVDENRFSRAGRFFISAADRSVNLLLMLAPIMAVCISVGSGADTEAYTLAFDAAFCDSDIQGFGPVGMLPLLDVTEVRHFHCASPEGCNALLQSESFSKLQLSCERLLLVVVDATPLGPNDGVLPYRVPLDSSGVPFYVMVVTLFVSPRKLFQEDPFEDGRSSSVVIGLDDLDERDLQVPFFVLHLLRTATALLAAKKVRTGKPCVFFSHAKRDGVPLARGAKMWLDRLPGFLGFYDTDDLDLAQDWRAQLSSAVETSILVVFRTEIFDQRYWCRQEVLWADEHRRPLVCVDARWQLQHESSLISFDSSPAVRVPDGSIVRILVAALREAFRVTLFERRVSLVSGAHQGDAKPIPRPPSLVSLASVRREFDQLARSASPGQKLNQYIVYPNPAVPDEVRKSVEELVEVNSVHRHLRVRSFDEWCSEAALTP
jgi:hypothetical protein